MFPEAEAFTTNNLPLVSTSQLDASMFMVSPLSPITNAPVVVRVPEMLLEPMVPPDTVRASMTSLSAQGLSVLTQLPVMVSSWDKEAGPPAPQSKVIFTSVVPEAVILKAPPSKDREAIEFNFTPPSRSLISRLAIVVLVSVSVSRSVPQEKCPAFQTNLPVVAIQVCSPPPWKELASNPLEMFRDPLKEEDVVVALRLNILEILATIPEDETISKKAFGVLSPSPNLPPDLDEKIANEFEVGLVES